MLLVNDTEAAAVHAAEPGLDQARTACPMSSEEKTKDETAALARPKVALKPNGDVGRSMRRGRRGGGGGRGGGGVGGGGWGEG